MLGCNFNRRLFLAGVLAVTASGCSYQQAYQGMQDAGKQQHCRDIIDEAERAKCEQNFAKDYDTYKKQREAVMQGERE